ncbi:MAG: hypothetical protein QW275_02590 [Candidatus Anstonellaceae archaeon]
MKSRCFLAQGATEYLIILAVVLVVALVGLVLLGDAFGRTGDAKLSQSQSYWSSTYPLSIVASSVYRNPSSTMHYPYLRIKNTGTDPIRLRGIVVQGTALTTYRSSSGASQQSMSQNIYIAPGKEICFGGYGSGCPYSIGFTLINPGTGQTAYMDSITALSSLCDLNGGGYIVVEEFGFDYDIIKGNSVVSKRLVGQSPLVIACSTCSGGNQCYWA